MYRTNYKPKRKRQWSGILIPLILIAGILGGIYYFLDYYKVETVYVDGNLHYTNDEIKEIVMAGPLGDNSQYLSHKYKNKVRTDVPFVAAMDVSILTNNTIRINVYEKSLAGYVEYLGRYMYFDKEGTIVESSNVITRGIPKITGLVFDHIVVGEPLPVKDADVFYQILEVTKTLKKYELVAERMYFSDKKEMTIYFQEIKVLFGTDKLLNEKIILLKNLFPDLEGKSGTLNLANYSESTKTFTFEPK